MAIGLLWITLLFSISAVVESRSPREKVAVFAHIMKDSRQNTPNIKDKFVLDAHGNVENHNDNVSSVTDDTTNVTNNVKMSEFGTGNSSIVNERSSFTYGSASLKVMKSHVNTYGTKDSGQKTSNFLNTKDKFAFSDSIKHKSVQNDSDKVSVIDDIADVLNSTKTSEIGAGNKSIVNARSSFIYTNAFLEVTKGNVNTSVTGTTGDMFNKNRNTDNETHVVETNRKAKRSSSCRYVALKEGVYRSLGNATETLNLTLNSSFYKQTDETMTVCEPKNERLQLKNTHQEPESNMSWKLPVNDYILTFYSVCYYAALAVASTTGSPCFFYSWLILEANMYIMILIMYGIAGSPLTFLRHSVIFTECDFTVALGACIMYSLMVDGRLCSKCQILTFNAGTRTLTVHLFPLFISAVFSFFMLVALIFGVDLQDITLNTFLTIISFMGMVSVFVRHQSKFSLQFSQSFLSVASFQWLMYASWLLGSIAITHRDYLRMILFTILVSFGRVLNVLWFVTKSVTTRKSPPEVRKCPSLSV